MLSDFQVISCDLQTVLGGAEGGACLKLRSDELKWFYYDIFTNIDPSTVESCHGNIKALTLHTNNV